MEKVLANEEFMPSFLRVLRNIAHQSVLFFKPEGTYWEGCEDELAETMKYGQLSGDMDFIGLSSGLDVNFVQVMMGRNNYQVTVSVFHSKRDQREGKVVVSVALVSGHFYTFYPKDLEVLEYQQASADMESQFRSAFTRIPQI